MPQTKTMNKATRTLTALLVVLFGATAYCLSPELNYPRIGDKLNVLTLSNVRATIKADSGYVDLSNAEVVKRENFKVYRPATEDSVTTMTVVQGNRIQNLVTNNNLLYKGSATQPGEHRIYAARVPYGAIVDSLRSHAVESTGKISAIGDFRSTGVSASETVPNTVFISLDGDTVLNAELIRTRVDETFSYQYSDSVRHVGLEEQWYIPGYRYPALTYSDNIMITAEGDTIDHVRRWEAIDLSEQKYDIKDDPTNELLRNSLKEPKNMTNFAKGNNHNPSSSSFRSGNVEWNADTETLTVIPQLNEDAVRREYVLCDSHGRVYASGKLSISEPLSISLSAFPPGVYIFGVNNETDVFTLKISKG